MRGRGRRFVIGPVVLGLLAVQGGGAGLATSSTAVGTSASAAAQAKPDGGLEVVVQPAPGRPAVGARAIATAVVTPEAELTSLGVVMSASGPVRLDGSAETTLSVPGPGQPVDIAVPFVVTGEGSGQVRLDAAGLDAGGRKVVGRIAVLYIESDGRTVYQSTGGPLEARVRRVEAEALPPEARRARIDQLVGGGASVRTGRRGGRDRPERPQQKPAPAEAPSSTEAFGAEDQPVLEAPGGTITVQGRVLYTDSAGNPHPVRRAAVEIYDLDGSGSALLSAVATDSDGNYSATVGNDDGDASAGQDVFVRALARTDGFDVRLPATGQTHRMDSAVTPDTTDVPDGTTLTIDLTANNTDDNNTAFDVHDALVSGMEHATALAGGTAPPLAKVNYPTGGTGYSPSSATMGLLRFDRFDWDVILHEYGHHVSVVHAIQASPGGGHSTIANLSETVGRDKSAGIRLAWGEGYATYFSLSGQQAVASGLGIPNVADARYTDTEDSTVDDDLETTPADRPSLGEDNELTVGRILWDVYDAVADLGDDRGVATGTKPLFDALKSGGATTLSKANDALVAARTAQGVADLGCILTEQRVAPTITSPVDGASVAAPPQISWTANGGGPKYRNNRFVALFYNGDFSTLLFQAPEQTGTRFTPSSSAWSQVVAQAQGDVQIVVRGRQTVDPATGPYTSCNVRVVPAEPTPGAPDTTITKGPSRKVKSSTVEFGFTATVPGATFECSLDAAPFEACTSLKVYSGITKGKHTFAVRASNEVGTDSTPATRSWKRK